MRIKTNSLNKIFSNLINDFWFSPQDAFFRAPEEYIWSMQNLTSPVLEIGSGDGHISKHIFSTIRKIDVGIDASANAIKKARMSQKYGRLYVANAALMPFKKASFATVISNSTYEHIKNDRDAVAETSRVLQRGGRFLFTVPTKRLKKEYKKLSHSSEEFISLNKRIDHRHYRNFKEWEIILKDSGLIVDDYEYYVPQKLVELWYKLFKVATFKPYKRELWSYLKDSPYGRLVPASVLKYLYRKLFEKYSKDMFTKNGCWLFIVASKRK